MLEHHALRDDRGRDHRGHGWPAAEQASQPGQQENRKLRSPAISIGALAHIKSVSHYYPLVRVDAQFILEYSNAAWASELFNPITSGSRSQDHFGKRERSPFHSKGSQRTNIPMAIAAGPSVNPPLME
jgi:hypothetical protein